MLGPGGRRSSWEAYGTCLVGEGGGRRLKGKQVDRGEREGMRKEKKEEIVCQAGE